MISAKGEQQAATKLTEAARILSELPEALQIRYLTALQEVAGENSTIIVFPLPIEFLRAFAPKSE